MDIGDGDVEFTRGFVIVDAIIKGKIFRFVNTHLEVRSSPGSIFRVFQSAQMYELLGTIDYLDGIPFLGNRPVIMVGDFNSSLEDVRVWAIIRTDHPMKMSMVSDVEELRIYLPICRQWVPDTWMPGWSRKHMVTVTPAALMKISVTRTMNSKPASIYIFLDPLDLSIDKVKCKVVGDEDGRHG